MKRFLLLAVTALCALGINAQSAQPKSINLHMKDGTVQTFDFSLVDSLTFTYSSEDPGELLKDQFTISVSDITWGDAQVTITPKDETMKYYYYAMTMEKVGTIEGGIDGLQQYDYNWWEMMSTYYSSLNEAIQNDLVSGTSTFRTSELTGGMGKWSSDIVVYCYGIDSEGEPSTELQKVTFTTTGCGTSSNTFSVSIDQATPTGVALTVTPSNDDKYFVAVQRERYVSYYGDDTEAMAFNLLSTYYNSADYFHTGTWSSEASDYTLNSGQTYYAIVFGYDNGLSTPVTMVKFNTPRSASTVSYRFSTTFMNDDDSDVNPEMLTKTAEGEYNCTVESASEACELFTYITNIETSATDTFSYAYDFGDETAKLAFSGTSTASADGVFATLQVSLADYPGVKTIRFVASAPGE